MTYLSLSSVKASDTVGYLYEREAERQNQPDGPPHLAAGVINSFHPLFTQRAQGPLGIIHNVFNAGFEPAKALAAYVPEGPASMPGPEAESFRPQIPGGRKNLSTFDR